MALAPAWRRWLVEAVPHAVFRAVVVVASAVILPRFSALRVHTAVAVLLCRGKDGIATVCANVAAIGGAISTRRPVRAAPVDTILSDARFAQNVRRQVDAARFAHGT